MDSSSLQELVYDPSKCNKLSVEQKRELVHEMSKWPDDAMEMLSSWSRHEILQILCAELGKERRYTGIAKSKMIDLLLKIVLEKKSQPSNDPSVTCDPSITTSDLDEAAIFCKNSACRAKMRQDDAFCRRCSCCICMKYDDNKDPSLWLICNSETPFEGISCGISSHLECVLQQWGSSNERFQCSSCGKMNDLLSSWRKQMVVAKETRRVDILCYRLSLARKILSGTKLYRNPYLILEEAVTKLEEELGPLTGSPVKTARGIVNRLSSGPHIQKLCTSAIDSLDSLLSSTTQSGKETTTTMTTLNGDGISSLDEDEGGRKMMPSSKPGPMKRKIGKRIATKKQQGDEGDDGREFEYCTKAMRRLECGGHIETSFRQKFLSWYGTKANPREARAVRVFIDLFGEDDPKSLAEQLVDTFSDLVSNSSALPSGFCFKLWH